MNKTTVKNLLRCLTAVFLTFSVCLAASADNTAYKTYTSKAFHFQIKVPLTWKIGGKPSPSFNLTHYPEVATFQSRFLRDSRAQVRITADVAYPAPDIRDLAFLIEAKARLLEGYREREPVRALSDRVYFRYSYNNLQKKAVFCTRALILRAEHPNLFDITCIAASEADNLMAQNEFIAIIKSFSFVRPPASKAGKAATPVRTK
ncbi:MAG: hypothetical protein V2A78_12095 [bacterium]